MAILGLKYYPDPVLKKPTTLISKFDEALHKYLDDMQETMYESGGVGLASPQVGVLHRIAVIDCSEDKSGALDLINPKIISREGSVSSEEGCLSIPGFRDTLKRSRTIIFQAQDRHGKEFEMEVDGLLCMCVQHEIDHLDGVLITDRLSRIKRELFKRWHLKQVEAGEYP